MDISVQEFLKKAVQTSEYFGFRAAPTWKSRRECANCTDTLSHDAKAEDRKLDGVFGLLSGGINSYVDGRLHALNEPVFHYGLERVPRTNEPALVLQVFGVDKPIAEAILIQTIRSLLSDIGLSNHVVRINSLGDRDSQNRYTRELTSFFRKRLEEMPPPARELMKEHSTSALLNLLEKRHELAYKSPSPLEHLSDQSRRHFREIVEYLDMSETPYEIDPKLMAHYHCYHDALFSFDMQDEHGSILEEQPIYVRGGRYGTFFEKHLKKTVPAAGAVVVLKGKEQPERSPKSKNHIPFIHMIHLGFAPKVRSLLLIDELRRVGIAVDQNLASDSLSSQLRRAEEKGARYTIIMGQKEYVEHTVILRDMVGKNQETVSLADLPIKLKRAAAKLAK